MNKKLNKKTILLIAFITSLFIHGIYLKIVEFNEYLKEKNQRIYTGQYKERIKDKYPKEFAKGEQYRQKILKSIKSEKKSKNDNVITIEYFDEKERVVYKVVQSVKTTVVSIGSTKGTNTHAIEVFPAEEEGYIYNDKDQIIKKILVPKQMPYTVKSFDEDNFYTYLKNGGNDIILYDIKYPSENERIEIEEFCSNLSWTQFYIKVEKKYVNNKLVYEKEFQDQERKDSFIMVNIEKKYNEKGELSYKTVERKDKTNDYKSFTEMDFAKDEIVTKYYKGKNVFATVTENLVGPVETIEETEMIRGEEVKKVYKNKVKAIVKRQKVGEPVKIVDVIEYDKKSIASDKDSDKLLTIRYIFDDKGILKYKIIGNKHIQYNYLYDNYISSKINSFNYFYTNDSFFNLDKKDKMFVYMNRFKSIEKSNDKAIEIMDVLEKRINEEYDNISIGEINEKNYKIINSKENIKTITLEELLNGYKYE